MNFLMEPILSVEGSMGPQSAEEVGLTGLDRDPALIRRHLSRLAYRPVSLRREICDFQLPFFDLFEALTRIYLIGDRQSRIEKRSQSRNDDQCGGLDWKHQACDAPA